MLATSGTDGIGVQLPRSRHLCVTKYIRGHRLHTPQILRVLLRLKGCSTFRFMMLFVRMLLVDQQLDMDI